MNKKNSKAISNRFLGLFFNHNNKGQGFSLNVIIVAVLALIILVVLALIFTGKIAIFQEGTGEAKTELSTIKVAYGPCHPGASVESTFRSEYSAASKLENIQEVNTAKAEARNKLQDEIGRCNNFVDKTSCEADGLCDWS
ncbi:hypothetical protein J4228_01570 [Candidatus Woesearchaeota archaeon]|nr:hypothetical protein [Candidatus Woesearchaeota archaeon]